MPTRASSSRGGKRKGQRIGIEGDLFEPHFDLSRLKRHKFYHWTNDDDDDTPSAPPSSPAIVVDDVVLDSDRTIVVDHVFTGVQTQSVTINSTAAAIPTPTSIYRVRFYSASEG